jgi:dCMP deaminase
MEKARMSRPSIEQYAMSLAYVASTRSEDPYNKVGAVALTLDNRVIATAYNGLPSKFKALPGFFDDRDNRLKFMIHAEQNLCSLIKRNEAAWIAITMMPCPSCMMLLIAHGIRDIYFNRIYERAKGESIEVANMFGVNLRQTP